jgi:hypothetical protein
VSGAEGKAQRQARYSTDDLIVSCDDYLFAEQPTILDVAVVNHNLDLFAAPLQASDLIRDAPSERTKRHAVYDSFPVARKVRGDSESFSEASWSH